MRSTEREVLQTIPIHCRLLFSWLAGFDSVHSSTIGRTQGYEWGPYGAGIPRLMLITVPIRQTRRGVADDKKSWVGDSGARLDYDDN